MNRPLFVLVASIFLGSALAGCVGGKGTKLSTPEEPALQGRQHVLDVLNHLPYQPGYRTSEALPWWVNFVKTYTKREWGTPMAEDAAKYLESELKRIGFKSETLVYKAKLKVAGLETVEGDFRVVRGIKEGTGNKSHRIALVSHYDVHTGTTEGAYDDGAGTAVQFETCKLLARVPTNKTIECIFFDGEEKGLAASEAFVKDFQSGGKDYVYDMAFGYDMTGLNYPSFDKWKLWVYAGLTQNDKFTDMVQESNMAFLNITMYDFLQPRQNVKPEGVEVQLRNPRNSDERQFERLLGVPVVRFAGGRVAGDYPMYHLPGDTVEFVYLFACGYCREFQTLGRDIFAKGMEFDSIVSYYTIMAYDQFDPMQIPLTVKDQPAVVRP